MRDASSSPGAGAGAQAGPGTLWFARDFGGDRGGACAIVSGVFASPSSSNDNSSQRRALLNLSSPFKRTFHHVLTGSAATTPVRPPNAMRSPTYDLAVGAAAGGVAFVGRS